MARQKTVGRFWFLMPESCGCKNRKAKGKSLFLSSAYKYKKTDDTMSKAEATPPRHNYENMHTPIASAKRPRQSIEEQTGGLKSSSKTVAAATPPRSGAAVQMSPMHPPKAYDQEDWVNRKVDGLFAPVLSFLNSHHEDSVSRENGTTMPGSSTHNVVSVSTEDEDEEDTHSCAEDSMCVSEIAEDDFNPWQFIKYLPPYDSVQHLRPPVTLPPKDPHLAPRVSLVLDLDETLVHCTVDPIDNPDLVFPVQFNFNTYQVHVRLRPHLQTFLEKIKGKFEVIIFTASQKVYADTLLDLIDPGKLHVGSSDCFGSVLFSQITQ